MTKVLELFAGSRSFSRVAESPKFGFKTYTTDNVEFDGIDQVCDIFDFNIEKCTWALGGSPDIVWASPPCTTFSVASFGHHWYPNRKPKTEASKVGLKIIERTVELIQFCMDLNEKCKFVIENPRGMLRKLDLIPFEMYTVTYCQYGDTRMKPTDIWTNINWIPRKMCKNGDSCHVSAPRGSRTGTQGLKNDYERSKVPYQLCKELIEYYLYA
jgi:site-specific DNA-cytosine methylase